MRSLMSVTGMLARGGTPAERDRTRLMAAGAMLATWFLFGAANVLALRGHLNERLGPASQPGTRGGTVIGTVTGAATYLLLQWAARRVLLNPRSPADVGVPPLLCAAAMAVVIVAAAVSGLRVPGVARSRSSAWP